MVLDQMSTSEEEEDDDETTGRGGRTEDGSNDTAAKEVETQAPTEPKAEFGETASEGKEEEEDAKLPPLPDAAQLKRMKKAELVALAEEQGVDSSGTKDANIARLQ